MGTVDEFELENRVRQILIAELQLAPQAVGSLDLQTPLLGRGLGLDSMEALTLATSLEQQLGIQIPDAELTPALFSSFSSLLQFIRTRLEGGTPATSRAELID